MCPVAFFVGASGLMPEEFGAKAHTADQIEELYPDLKIGKNEKEGTFFVVGDSIITVFTSSVYFSTGRKADAA